MKARRLRQETGNPELHTEWELPDRTLGNVIRSSLIRPFRLLGTQIIIQTLAVYMAYLYGVLYLMLSTFPSVWEDVYHESVGIGGLNYISLGIGFFIGAQSTARMNDKIYVKLKQRNNNIGRPEFRVPLMIPGALLSMLEPLPFPSKSLTVIQRPWGSLSSVGPRTKTSIGSHPTLVLSSLLPDLSWAFSVRKPTSWTPIRDLRLPL